jgi:photosystem II stability/assembly factor-like uncharacterized protein
MLKRFVAVAAILFLAGVGPGPIGGVTAAGAADLATGATGSQSLLAVSCPTVTVCYAGGDGGTLLATRDDGATWQSQSWQSQFAQSLSNIVSIACPSTGDCGALVQAGCEELGAHVPVLHTSDGGSHWTTSTLQGCASTVTCPGISTPRSPARL